jgi:hypothetical protein
MPMRRTGTCGNAFANRNPDVLGRNPGTLVLGIAASSMPDEPYRVRGASPSRGYHDDVSGPRPVPFVDTSYRPPSASAEEWRGLLVARQLADLIQFAPGISSGTAVRLRIGRR